MLTLDRTAQPLALRERRPLQPPFLGGLLFLALEIVPLTAAGPLTPLRAVGIGALLLIASVLVMLGLPRTRGRQLPGSSAPSRLELGGDALPPTYRVTLVLKDGSRHRVLEGEDPARVLEDVTLLARQLELPLGAGWGLGEAELVELAAGGNEQRFATHEAATFEHPPLAGQRAAAWSMLWACGFVIVATFVMVDSPGRYGLVPSPLALTLPCLGALALLSIGLWLLGLRERVVLAPTGVVRRRLWFGRDIARVEAHVLRVGGAALVKPSTRSHGHLLVASRTGLMALPAEVSEAARLIELRMNGASATERAAE
jgi:hypothetical protein